MHFFTCQGEHWNERDSLLLANLIFFPHCFFSVAKGGIYHFVQEGKIPAIFSAVNAGSSMTCNRCSCQCNGTPVQLYFWLSPVLSRNHFTAPPPLIRRTSEGGRILLQHPIPFLHLHWSWLLKKQWNSTQKLQGVHYRCTPRDCESPSYGGVLQRSSLCCTSTPWLCSCTLKLAPRFSSYWHLCMLTLVFVLQAV